MARPPIDVQRGNEIAGRTLPAADGRNTDPALGALAGEAAAMEVARAREAFPTALPPAPVRARTPAEGAPASTYYGLPAIKAPVWKGYIPAYFYAGGLAGASAALATAAQLSGDPRLRRLVSRTRWVAAAGAVASGALLIADLGRPSRFIYMLRVFRRTSPMNVGTWLLAAFGLTSGAAALLRSRAAGIASGVFGVPLTAYTAVLISNTAVPVWNGARRTLPFLFVAASATSAASALEMLPAGESERTVVRRLAIAGKAAELLGGAAVSLELRRRGPGPVRAPLEQGRSSWLWRGARLLTAASLALDLIPRRRRWARTAAGALGTLGGIAMRFALVEAGRASALNPRATFEPQRARRAAPTP